jgi:hypothetical protein
MSEELNETKAIAARVPGLERDLELARSELKRLSQELTEMSEKLVEAQAEAAKVAGLEASLRRAEDKC